MRLELRDINGQNYSITSGNGKLIAEWFQEYLPQIYQAVKNTGISWSIYVYPHDNAEAAKLNWSTHQFSYIMRKAEDFEELEKLFRQAKERCTE